MLISFRIENFRSFAEQSIISMRPVKAYGEHPENQVEVDGCKLLKVAAIYGPNASGKSNVVKGFAKMRRLVLRSLQMSSVDVLRVEPFELDAEKMNAPTLFEISMLLRGRIYRYGFAATHERIVAEWLGVSQVGSRAVERMLFTREGDSLNSFNRRSMPELARMDMSTLLSNALLLPRLDQLNNAVAKAVMRWFKNMSVLSGSESSRYGSYSSEHIGEPAFHNQMMQFIRFADSSISDVSIRKQEIKWGGLSPSVRGSRIPPKGFFTTEDVEVLVARRNRQGDVVTFDIDDKESEGTAKMFELSGPLTDILNTGSVLVIDEMEAKLHPLLTRRIIRVFNSATANPHNAQLVFVTHDATLLHSARLRRDQVWFCEKDDFGASSLYCLAEIRSTAKARREDNLEKKYLEGRFGAIPRFPKENI